MKWKTLALAQASQEFQPLLSYITDGKGAVYQSVTEPVWEQAEDEEGPLFVEGEPLMICVQPAEWDEAATAEEYGK